MNNREKIIGRINRQDERRNRAKAFKVMMIIFAIILLLLPTFFCFILYTRMDQMQKQIDFLVGMHDVEYREYRSIDGDPTIVHAANISGGDAKTDLPKEDGNSIVKGDQAKSGENEAVYSDEELYGQKVYLTFDDGPSKNTEAILNILADYGVKGTFFVTGRTDRQSFGLYERIVEEGHTLGMHSFSHEYSSLYRSADSFINDYHKISDVLCEATGVRPSFYRFPGGSSNQVSTVDMQDLISYFDGEGITYFDWNVVSGDATGEVLTDQQMITNVLDGVKEYTSAIVLLHDAPLKEATVRILPELIEKLQDQNVTFLPITEHTRPVQHVKVQGS